MVSSILIDSLTRPTEAITELYESSKPSIDELPTAVSRHFAEIFKSPDAFHEIPVLNVSTPPNGHPQGSLVRFRAMVQDTSASPEMYLANRKQGKCGGWGLVDELSNDGGLNYADLRECTVLWAVSVPGESEWCAAELDVEPGKVASSGECKPTYPHKFPLPGVPHLGVQVKIYDTALAESIKSTEVVTFVGVLASDMLEENGPTLPILHVVFIEPHAPTLIPRAYGGDIAAALDSLSLDASESTVNIRKELVSWIAEEALGGDLDAAEWVLLTSIARVQSRHPAILPPSLTLTRFPTAPAVDGVSATPALSHILSTLLPLFHTLPLNLTLLNTTDFAPVSRVSEEAGGEEELHAGVMQAPAGISWLITESGVSEGTVFEKGLKNIRIVQDIITGQMIPYEFPYSQFSFPTDMTFIVLAEGRKSAFFQTKVVLPLSATGNVHKTKAEIAMPSLEVLERFRALIGEAKVGNVNVSEATSEYIQEDFVKGRQASGGQMTGEDLILRMTIARLIALSMGCTEVTREIWEHAKALDLRQKEKEALIGAPVKKT